MGENKAYRVCAYTKEGTYDHEVSIQYQDKEYAEECLRAYIECCAEKTGFTYKLREETPEK